MIKDRTWDHLYIRAFLLSLFTAAVIILPFVISGGGILYIFSDFNLQQIPFNILSNESIKSGNVFWSWNTDLGSSFIGAYSFYTLGSPFFWLSMLFSPKVFPYLAAPLLMLKFSFAGMTSFAYMQRFVKNKNYALLGSLLYAFSGFQIGNMFYNHFLDVTALFPLLLIALEELLVNDRKAFFALTVALNALMNYEFFVGETIFLLIYFICRLTAKEFRLTLKKFIILAFESLLGVCISAVLLLPSLFHTLQIPRATQMISEIQALFYHPSVYLDLFKAVLMPAEAVNRSLITATSWTSTEAYLPLFGIVLVMAYLFSRHKKNWLSLSLAVCLVFAAVPVLNSIFYLFNGEYYSRWFYMPVLLMALVSVKALEERDISIKKGIIAAAVLWFLFVCGLVFANRQQPVIINMRYLLFMLLLAAAGLLISIFVFRIRSKRYFFTVTTGLIILFAGASGIFNIWADSRNFPPPREFTKIYTDSGNTIHLPDGDNYRVDTTNCYMNTNIFMDKPSIDFFSSTVDGSIARFYSSLGLDRVNNSAPDFTQYGLRALLSVKYVVALNDTGLPLVSYGDCNELPSLKLYKVQGDYNIYENEDYIPIGFTFDHYVSQQQFDTVSAGSRHLTLLKAVVLDQQQVKKYSGLMTVIPASQLNDLSQTAYHADVAARQAETGYYFDRNNSGFTSKIKLGKDNLVFFSVPYDKGWSATVNGKPAAVENVDSGFMAVEGKAGENTIDFTYRPQGLKTGVIVTALSVLVLLLYLLTTALLKRKRPKR